METEERAGPGTLMTETMEKAPGRTEGLGYQTAKKTAVVGAVFGGVFAVVLVANLIGSAVIGPAREIRLDAMKLRVQKEPDNEELLTEIRQLDLKIRRDRLWRSARPPTCFWPASLSP